MNDVKHYSLGKRANCQRRIHRKRGRDQGAVTDIKVGVSPDLPFWIRHACRWAFSQERTPERMSCQKLTKRPSPQKAGDVLPAKCLAEPFHRFLLLANHPTRLSVVPVDINRSIPQEQLAIGGVRSHTQVRKES